MQTVPEVGHRRLPSTSVVQACTVFGPMAKDLSLGEAAIALGVSVDTLRRWDRAGRIKTNRDSRNRRLVPASEVRRLSGRPERHRTGTQRSARNRFPGVVRSVETDGVMALVEVEAGEFLVTAAITRDSIEELGLAPGVHATAVVKATSVMIERGSGVDRGLSA
jgi:molybdopterin-binding protein